MRYASLDLETTRIDPKTPDAILMISIVAENTKALEVPVDQLPHFTAIVFPDTQLITGSLTALAMNQWILVAIEAKRTKMTRDDFNKKYRELGILEPTLVKAWAAVDNYFFGDLTQVVFNANLFLDQHFGTKDRITLAGKNVMGFDMLFLPPELGKRFRHSAIDPGSVFVDLVNDDRVPDSTEVIKRSGVSGEGTHDALMDARIMVGAIRSRIPTCKLS